MAAVLAVAACGSARDSDSSGTEMTTQNKAPGWFGGYLDVTLLPALRLQDVPADSPATIVLSFISSDPARPCEPSWGGSYDLEQAGTKLDLDAQVDTYRKAGGRVAVSFGGQLGTELAVGCTDAESLATAYSTVIDRYGLDIIDLDVEGKGASDAAAAGRRAAAIARLQADRPDDRPLHVWLTLPVSRDGLTTAAELSVTAMLDAGVEVAGVNIMTMNFGTLPEGQTMLDASVGAAEATHQTLTGLFEKAGQPAGADAVWTRIGLTPMVGGNDVEDNVFTLDDAAGLNTFAIQRGIGRMSMWSLNRDLQCDAEHQGVSHSCSGLAQDPGMFAKKLGVGFNHTG